MLKEIATCVIIILLIFAGNTISQSYTNNTMDETVSELENFKSTVNSYEAEKNTEKIKEIYNKWEEKQELLAYYIEHDELEKVQTNLVSIKSYTEISKYDEVVNEIDKTIYIINHIKDKYKISFQNIF